MQTKCPKCQLEYDDAEHWTTCPHERFISSDDRNRKDLAFSLVHKPLKFRNLNAGAALYIQSISDRGYVTFRNHTGEYDPHFFEVAE